MRRPWVAVLLLGLWPGCGAEPRPGSADVLILELGGDHEPLRQALLRSRRRAAPEREEAPAPAPAAAAAPPAPPPPAASSEPEHLTVYLRQGETVYGLCRERLGTAARWREVLELNGWSEARAASLPVGTPVKLPLR